MVPRAGNRHRLGEFGIAALVAESPSDPADAKGEYGVEFVPLGHFTKLHELITRSAAPDPSRGVAGTNCLPRSRRRGVCRCQVGGSA